MKIDHLDHLVVTTQDLEKCLHFYVDILGMDMGVVPLIVFCRGTPEKRRPRRRGRGASHAERLPVSYAAC